MTGYYSFFAVLLSLLLWGLFFTIGAPDLWLTIIISVVLILYIPAFKWDVLKKFRLQGLLFMIALTTGIYGYISLTDDDYSVLSALYSTFRLFILDADHVFAEHAEGVFPLAIEIARWCAAAYTISTIFSIIYYYFNQSLRLLWYGITGKHIIVSGFHAKSAALIENLRKENYRVVLLAEDVPDSQREQLHELGVIVQIGKKGDPALLRKGRFKRADYYIIFHEEDTDNLNALLAFHAYVSDANMSVRLKQVIVHLSNQQSFALFEDMEAGLTARTKAGGKLPFKTFSLPGLVAEKVLNDKPLYASYEKRVRNPQGEPLHLLFIGFGNTGQQVAAQAIERAHFMNPEPVKITVLDKDADKVKKQWYDNYPQSDAAARIAFRQMDIEEASIQEYISKHLSELTHVFICLQDHFLDEGLSLAKKFPHLPIYLKLNAEAHAAKWLQANEPEYRNLQLFGVLRTVLNGAYVINDAMEKTARQVHENYVEAKKAAGSSAARTKPDVSAQADSQQDAGAAQRAEPQPWHALSAFLRESNRSQLNHAATKLMLLGMKAVPEEEAQASAAPVTATAYAHAAQAHLELIARAEHMRWNAFHFMRGWQVLTPVEKDTRKDTKNKRHHCLVSYEALDDIERVTGEKVKDFDRKAVTELYDTMLSAGYVIVPYEAETSQ